RCWSAGGASLLWRDKRLRSYIEAAAERVLSGRLADQEKRVEATRRISSSAFLKSRARTPAPTTFCAANRIGRISCSAEFPMATTQTEKRYTEQGWHGAAQQGFAADRFQRPLLRLSASSGG